MAFRRSRTRALPAPAIPAQPVELTAEWLTGALRPSGLLSEGTRVTGVEHELLGKGEGFVGTIVRLRLQLDRPDPKAPASLIAKLPTVSLTGNRAVGELAGAYEREIHFYQELADRVPIATPRCYYADMDPNPLAGREPAVVAFLDRLPVWLIRLLLPFVTWLAGLSRRRYVLLLEDLSNDQAGRIGDQLAGCGPTEAEAALRNLARLHAAFWKSPELDQLSYLLRIDALARWFDAFYRRAKPATLRKLEGSLTPELIRLADWLDGRAEEIAKRLVAFPETLLHGDYRLDNLCLRDQNGALAFTVFDWQMPVRGPGAFEAAYFITGNVHERVARDCEQNLLAAYHDELVQLGVQNHPFAEAEHAYRLSKLLIVHRIIMGLDMLDPANERGAKLLETMIARQFALVPDDYERLLD